MTAPPSMRASAGFQTRSAPAIRKPWGGAPSDVVRPPATFVNRTLIAAPSRTRRRERRPGRDDRAPVDQLQRRQREPAADLLLLARVDVVRVADVQRHRHRRLRLAQRQRLRLAQLRPCALARAPAWRRLPCPRSSGAGRTGTAASDRSRPRASRGSSVGNSVRYCAARSTLLSPWYQMTPAIGRPANGATSAFHSTVGLAGIVGAEQLGARVPVRDRRLELALDLVGPGPRERQRRLGAVAAAARRRFICAGVPAKPPPPK